MSRPTWTAVVVAALCLTLAAPAQAARTITRDDVRGDGARDRDITKVTTLHGDRRIVLRTRMHRASRLSDEVWHLVDTRGGRAPDFLVFTVVTSEVTDEPAVAVRRVAGWPRRRDPYRLLHDGEPVACGLTAGDVSERRRLLTVTLGRGCLRADGGAPGRVRLTTFATAESGRITDRVPAWRAYGAWTPAA